MQALAQRKEHKKERSSVIICPRCGASNLAAQSSCGRCGLVFPKEKAIVKGKGGELPGGAPSIPSSLAGAPARGNGGDDEDRLPGGAGGDEAVGSSTPSAPQRPKHIPESGVSEGIRKESGGSPLCPRCGTEMKEGVKRCPRCGYRK